MIPKQILFELTPDEIGELDFKAMGNLVLNRAISLSQVVNNELLEPISQWLDDAGFMKEFAINIDILAGNSSEKETETGNLPVDWKILPQTKELFQGI